MSPVPKSLQRQFFRTLNSVVEPVVRKGLGSPLPIGVGAVVLETTGRKSGLPRRVPLLAARLGKNIYVSTVREESQWIKNLEADSSPTVWLNGREVDIEASVDEGPLQVANLRLAK